MVAKAIVDEFLAQPVIAVVGVSQNPNKFGRIVYKDMKHKGYHVLGVNPKLESVIGDPCYPSLEALPEKPGAVVTVVQPSVTEEIVKECARLGIQRVWMQQGSESPAAIQFCQQNGIQVVHGECIMMFTRPVQFPHSLHRIFNKVTGKLPK